MTTLLFGSMGAFPVPQDEKTVRITTAPVTPDAPPAMADSAPDPQEVETDPNPTLGMSTRQLASTWHEGKQYVPSWKGAVDDNHLHNDIVDRQVSTSGTAASREAAGVFGHGTMSFAEGIEPVSDLRDGGKMTNEYFMASRNGVQSPAGQYMTTPPGADDSTSTKAAAASAQAARAATANAYRTMWAGMQS